MLPVVLFISCIKPVKDSVDESKTMLIRKNLICISGISSETPYIEIQHCIDNGSGKNIIEKLMVSPPYLLEGNFVNIVYDSITIYMGDDPINYQLWIKRDFSEDGADYLQIINHSDVSSIEFFIAGTQNIITEDGNRCGNYKSIEYLPSIYYKKAPIYYLLKPEAKYTQNLSGSSSECGDIFYFEGNRCGDLFLENAWEINDVVKLYRAEYNNSKDTVLYVDNQSLADGGRLINAVNSTQWRYNRLYNGKFYGVIPPKGRLVGNEQLWLTATNLIFEENFENGDL